MFTREFPRSRAPLTSDLMKGHAYVKPADLFGHAPKHKKLSPCGRGCCSLGELPGSYCSLFVLGGREWERVCWPGLVETQAMAHFKMNGEANNTSVKRQVGDWLGYPH